MVYGVSTELFPTKKMYKMKYYFKKKSLEFTGYKYVFLCNRQERVY